MRTSSISPSALASTPPSSTPAPESTRTDSVENDPLLNLDSFVRVRGDKNGDEVVYYWEGSIYSDVEGQRSRRLFDFEGYNVARTVPDPEGGWQLLGRELAV